jgi:hypothetical protein
MTKQEAIDDAVKFAEPYLENRLTDTQAARIGRRLYSNLKQAERDSEKEKKE